MIKLPPLILTLSKYTHYTCNFNLCVCAALRTNSMTLSSHHLSRMITRPQTGDNSVDVVNKSNDIDRDIRLEVL